MCMRWEILPSVAPHWFDTIYPLKLSFARTGRIIFLRTQAQFLLFFLETKKNGMLSLPTRGPLEGGQGGSREGVETGECKGSKIGGRAGNEKVWFEFSTVRIDLLLLVDWEYTDAGRVLGFNLAHMNLVLRGCSERLLGALRLIRAYSPGSHLDSKQRRGADTN